MSDTCRRMVKVKLLGELGRKFGRSYKFMAVNSREVLSALSRQIKGFKEYLATAHENGIGFKLVTGDPKGIDYDGVLMSCNQLIIAPVVTGSGGRGVGIGQILLGVALVALAFVPFGQSAAFAGLAAGSKAIGSAALFSLGASLTLTGIAGLLSPTPTTPNGDTRKKESFLFDRAAELTVQGFVVPVVYGEYLVEASLIISSSIDTDQIPA